MNSTWLRSIFSGETAEGDAFSASTLNITKFVSIFVLLFAAIAQVLAWIGVITLSTTQQVAIWLVVAGLIVLISIADMACRAYVTAKKYQALAAMPRDEPTSPTAAGPQDEPTSQPAEGRQGEPTSPTAASPPDGSTSQPSQPGTSPPIPPDGPHAPWTVPSGNGNPGNGSRLPVKMSDVFPHGCYLVQDPISETQDCDNPMETLRVVDRETSKWVFSCRVTDMHPELKGKPRQTEVRVVADQMPDLSPPADGSPFIPIEFEGLTAAAPPTIDRGRVAYTSVRATSVRRIEPTPAHGSGQEGDGVTASR